VRIPLLAPRLRALVDFCHNFVGVREEGGDNKGFWVSQFQEAVDGKASQEAWCLCFIMYCLKQVAKVYGDHALFKTEHVLTMWNRSPIECRMREPMEGAIMIWQYYDNAGKPTARGHAGVVKEVVSKELVTTIEGNTSNTDKEIVREGDVVAIKTRSVKGSPKMRVVGWLVPWIV